MGATPTHRKNLTEKNAMLKGLIILLYYDRHNLVHNALDSIRHLQYDNYVVYAIDDGSEVALKPIVEMHYADINDKFIHIRIDDSIAQKEKQGGTRIGNYINKAMAEASADFVVILCDDDALVPEYFGHLDKWFTKHSEVVHCYSHIIDFNPLAQRVDVQLPVRSNLNYLGAVSGVGDNKLVISQIAWRPFSLTMERIYFPKNSGHGGRTMMSWFISALYQAFGDFQYTGFRSQFRGCFDGQLSKREEIYEGVECI